MSDAEMVPTPDSPPVLSPEGVSRILGGLGLLSAGHFAWVVRVGEPRAWLGAAGAAAVLIGLDRIQRGATDASVRRHARRALLFGWITVLSGLVAWVPDLPKWIELPMGLMAIPYGWFIGRLSLRLSAIMPGTNEGGTPFWWRIAGWAWMTVGVFGLLIVAAIALATQGSLQLRWTTPPPGPLPCIMGVALISPYVLFAIAASASIAAASGPKGVCPRCGYDLSGLTGPKCPECATNVAEVPRRAPESAAAAPRPAWVERAAATAGVVALVTAVAWFPKPGNGIEQHKPAWLLMRDAVRVGVPGRDPQVMTLTQDGARTRLRVLGVEEALIELGKRAAAQTLTREETRSLVEMVLREYERAEFPGAPWPELVQELAECGAFTEADVQRFFRSFYTFEVVTRPRVEAGRPVPFEVVTRAKGASGLGIVPDPWQFIQELDVQMLEVDVGGARTVARRQMGWGSASERITRWTAKPGDEGELSVVAPVAPGRATLRLLLQMTWREERDPSWSHDRIVQAGLPITWTLEPATEFEVLPAGESSLREVHDPTLRTKIEERLSLRASIGSRDGEASGTLQFEISDPRSQRWVNGELEGGDPPQVGAAFEVFAELDGERHLLESAGGALRTDSGAPRIVFLPLPLDLVYDLIERDATSLRIVLVPSKEAAERRTDIDAFWSGEEIVRDASISYLHKRFNKPTPKRPVTPGR